MPELDARIHAGEESSRKVPGSWPTLQTKPDRLLHAGDRVGSLEVVASPATRRVTLRSSTRATARCSPATSSRRTAAPR